MQVITLSESTKLVSPTVITMGNFDGVHLGHRILLEKLISRAEQQRISSVVVTFEPHTREIITGEKVGRLTTLDEKIILLGQYEIDYLVVVPFDSDVATLGKDQFRTKVLENQLNAVEFIMGEDHRFGRNSTKSEKNLSFEDGKNDISRIIIKLYGENSITAGSTEVRNYLSKGKISDAVNMLGHPYLVLGTRVRGKHLGTELGYPTLNFTSPPSQKMVPLPGVYVAEVEFGSSKLKGCLYYGECPTFGDREIHFEFFSLDLVEKDPFVGESCRIWIHQHIRDEQKFSNSDKLVAQITRDVKTIRNYFVKE